MGSMRCTHYPWESEIWFTVYDTRANPMFSRSCWGRANTPNGERDTNTPAHHTHIRERYILEYNWTGVSRLLGATIGGCRPRRVPNVC